MFVANKLTTDACVFFVLTVFFRSLHLNRRHFSNIAKFVSPLHAIFSLYRIKAGDPERVRWVHFVRADSQSEHRVRVIWPTEATSNMERKQIMQKHSKFAFAMELSTAWMLHPYYKHLKSISFKILYFLKWLFMYYEKVKTPELMEKKKLTRVENNKGIHIVNRAI